MKYLNFSEHESSLFHLAIARSSYILNDFDEDQLSREIFDMDLDVCKLKVDLSNPLVFQQLENIAFPFSFYSFLVKQEIQLDELDAEIFDEDFKIIDYDVSKKNELNELVVKILEEDTMNTYYANSLFDKIFKSEELIKTVADYQTNFDNSIHPDKHGFLAYKGERLIGFSTLQIHQEEGEGIFVGILPEFRSQSFFKNFVKKEMYVSKLKQCKTFTCSTIVFNTRSLQTTLNQGMKIKQVLFNLNIFPLLHKASERIFIDSSLKEIQSNILVMLSKHNNFKHKMVKSFKIKTDSNIEKIYKWEVLIHETLDILIFFNSEKTLVGHILLTANHF